MFVTKGLATRTKGVWAWDSHGLAGDRKVGHRKDPLQGCESVSTPPGLDQACSPHGVRFRISKRGDSSSPHVDILLLASAD